MTGASVALPVPPPVRPVVPAAIAPAIAPVVPAVRPVAPPAIAPPGTPVAPPGFQDVGVASLQSRLIGGDLRDCRADGREASRNAGFGAVGGRDWVDGLARRCGKSNGDAKCPERQKRRESFQSASWCGHGQRYDAVTEQDCATADMPRPPAYLLYMFTIKGPGFSSSTNTLPPSKL